MRISDSKRVVFVHLPKTGGASLEAVLDSIPDSRGPKKRRHDTLAQILETEPEVSSYWIFGFVRNPWARMLSWFRMVERCPRCDYAFEREEGFFLGAYVINIGVSQLVAVAFIAVGIISTLPDPPVGKLIVIGLLVVVATPFVFYPFSKTIWTACDMIMHPECLDR